MNVLYMLNKNIIFCNFNYFSFYLNYFFLKNFNYLFFFYYKSNFSIKKVNNGLKILKNNKLKNKVISNFLNNFIFYNLHKESYNSSRNVNRFKNNQYRFYYNNFKKMIIIIYNLHISKKNFLFLDSNYQDVYSLYTHMYNYNTLSKYSNYFFIDSYYFTHKNWLYFYKIFCANNNVLLIFIFNYKDYINYVSDFKSLDILTSAIILEKYQNFWVDYPFYCSSYNLSKFFLILLFKNIFFIYINHNNYKNKLIFLNLISKYFI